MRFLHLYFYVAYFHLKLGFLSPRVKQDSVYFLMSLIFLLILILCNFPKTFSYVLELSVAVSQFHFVLALLFPSK